MSYNRTSRSRVFIATPVLALAAGGAFAAPLPLRSRNSAGAAGRSVERNSFRAVPFHDFGPGRDRRREGGARQGGGRPASPGLPPSCAGWRRGGVSIVALAFIVLGAAAEFAWMGLLAWAVVQVAR